MKNRFAGSVHACIVLACVLACAGPVVAGEKTDVLVMKNGDRFTCQIKGMDQGVLYVSLDYAIQTISVDWKKVAQLESKQLFIVKTEDGTVYRGKLKAMSATASQPVKIEVLEVPTEPVTLEQSQVTGLVSTSERFWQRFNGAVSLGVIYTKGNQQTQYSLSSDTEYLRERWSAAANYTSNLSSSTGASASSRNALDLSGTHLWGKNNYYGGIGNFLQSSTQGINLQTTVGGGIGRYFKNTDKVKFSVLGGAAWIRTDYQPSFVSIRSQNLATAVIAADLKVFRFNKTNLSVTANLLPSVSEPGRVLFNTNASYYIKLISNLSWNVSFYGNWDNQPPAGLAGSDYGTSSGLSWSFGLK